MKKIGNIIVEPGIKDIDVLKHRNTVRGVILKDNLVYMLYSKLYNDYTFPGGGVKQDEDHLETLERELKEELGALRVEILGEVGFTEELRYGVNGSGSIYKQTSYYYYCNILEFGKPSYDGRENEQGLEGKWVSIDEVIKHNLKVVLDERENSKGFQTVLVRENLVLEYIKQGDNNFEKI